MWRGISLSVLFYALRWGESPCVGEGRLDTNDDKNSSRLQMSIQARTRTPSSVYTSHAVVPLHT